MAFNLALKAPEIVVVLRNILSQNEKMAEELEQQADLYSSYFLFHAAYDFVDTVPKHVFLSTRNITPQEIIWDLLTCFFPYENIGRFSWKEYEARSQRAMETWLRFSFGADSRSLLERYFVAMMKRVAYKQDIWSIFGHDSRQDAAELVYLFGSLSQKSSDQRSQLRKLLNDKIRTEQWHYPTSMEEFQSWFVEQALAYLGPEARDSIEIILPTQKTGMETICPVTVLVPSIHDLSAGVENKLVPLPGMSPIIAAKREEWMIRLPDHLLLIARLPQKSLRILENDAVDVARLVLLPTLDNLNMRSDRDWYGAADCLGGRMIELPKPHIAGTLEEWAIYCTQHCLRPEFQKLDKSQVKELLRIKLVEPDFAFQILKSATSAQEVDRMIRHVKRVLPLGLLPWEKENYFGSCKNASDYAVRILQECADGRLLDKDFWDFIFKVEKIFKTHKIPPNTRLAAIEIIREELIDKEIFGFFEWVFQCNKCGRSFIPRITQKYVKSTLTKKRVLCCDCEPSS